MSYSLLPPDDSRQTPDEDGRIEPRLSVQRLGRAPRFEEIAAPTSSEVAEHSSGGRFEAQPLDPIVAEGADARRRRGFPVFTTIGIAALLIGVGILAATCGRVVTGKANVVQAPVVETPALQLTPPPSPTEETAGPGVRVIPPSGAAKSAEPPREDTVANVAPAATSTPVAEPPKPRLRPATSSSETATAPAAGLPARGPVATLQSPQFPAPRLPRPRPAAPAQGATIQPQIAQPLPPQGQSSDADTAALMSSIDRILAERRPPGQAVAPQVAPQATGPQPLPAAMPSLGVGQFGGAAVALAPSPAAALPEPLPTGPMVIEQPLPGDAQLFPDGERIPVPPADIPASGQ